MEDAGRDISHLSRKFLSDAERRFLGEQPPNEELLLYWGAKEVIYKMYGRRKLDFRQDMFIRPFQVADKGGHGRGIAQEQQHDQLFTALSERG